MKYNLDILSHIPKHGGKSQPLKGLHHSRELKTTLLKVISSRLKNKQTKNPSFYEVLRALPFALHAKRVLEDIQLDILFSFS